MAIETSGMNRFELKDRLGIGGMGSVYRAFDRESENDVAIKLLHEHYSADPTFVTRFREEARLMARLDHANVARVLDYGRWEDRYYIAMDLVDGENLRHHMAGRGALSAEEATGIMLQASAGLAAAHAAGIIHRDLKPENILVGRDGQVKVCDFGLAKMAAATGMTASGIALGTAQYLSPEEVQGTTPGPEADIYALGVVLYEMLLGEPPFKAKNAIALAMKHLKERPPRPRDINPAIPAELEDIVMKALAKRPEQRFHDAEELRAALDGLPRKSPSLALRAPRLPQPAVARALVLPKTGFVPTTAWAPLGAIAAAVLVLGIAFQPGSRGTSAQGAAAAPATGANEAIVPQPPSVSDTAAPVEGALVAPAEAEVQRPVIAQQAAPVRAVAPAALPQTQPSVAASQTQPTTTYQTPSGPVALYQTASGPVLAPAQGATTGTTAMTTTTGVQSAPAPVTRVQSAPATQPVAVQPSGNNGKAAENSGKQGKEKD